MRSRRWARRSTTTTSRTRSRLARVRGARRSMVWSGGCCTNWRSSRMPETYTDSPLLTDRFDRAVQYALAHHRRQLRKGTEIPYFAHLLAVTAILLEMGGTEDEAIAA